MTFLPNWTSAPGITISNVLKEKKMSINSFAEKIECEKDFVNNLIQGKIPIDKNLADKLQNTLGYSSKFWINRDKIYRERSETLMAEWVSKLPIKFMKESGLISNSRSILDECLAFFGITNISQWNKKYGNLVENTYFRKSQTLETDPYSLAVWLRKAEIQAEKCTVAAWNKSMFEEKLLSEIKPLTRKKDPKVFLPKLAEICAKCGVVLSIVPQFGKTRVSGASKLIDNKTALIVISFRFLTDDHFWFTFFHEAGHLIMHTSEKLRLEIENNIDNEDEEKEADLFAEECLLPFPMQSEIYNFRSNTKKIINFSIEANISPGIVVGQMQHKKIISYNYLNSLKRKYSWSDISKGIEIFSQMKPFNP